MMGVGEQERETEIQCGDVPEDGKLEMMMTLNWGQKTGCVRLGKVIIIC